MDTVPLHGDLQINQDLRFSRREWRTQHVGWVVMLLFILAAALGAFGRGPLATRQAQSGNGSLDIEYAKVARHSAPDILRVEVAPEAIASGMVTIWFDRTWVHGRSVESISPEPEQSSAGGDRITYEFRIADPTRPAILAFETRPRDMGRQAAAIGIAGGDSLRFTQIVLP